MLSVVKHALKLVATDRMGGIGGNEVKMKLAIVAGEHHRICERLAGAASRRARVRADDRDADKNNTCWLWHFPILHNAAQLDGCEGAKPFNQVKLRVFRGFEMFSYFGCRRTTCDESLTSVTTRNR